MEYNGVCLLTQSQGYFHSEWIMVHPISQVHQDTGWMESFRIHKESGYCKDPFLFNYHIALAYFLRFFLGGRGRQEREWWLKLQLTSSSFLFYFTQHKPQNGNRTIRREKVNIPLSCLEESHLVTSNDKGKFISKQCTQNFHPMAKRLEHGPMLARH